MLSKEFLKIGNKLVFRVCLPTLLFCNISELEDLRSIPLNAVFFVLAVIAVLVLLGYFSTFVAEDKTQKGVMMQCIFRPNFALIGIPLAEMIGGSKGVSAVLAVGLVIGYIMIVSMLSSAMQGSDTSTTMYIMSLVYLIGAGIEFGAVIHIIKNNLNLQ